MGLFDKLTDGITNLLNGAVDFFQPTNTGTCSKCIKCRQCVKNLSIGQRRIFTCPAAYNGICDDEYIDSLLPSVENPENWPEYIEAYQKNRETIDDYIYNAGIFDLDSAMPIVNEDFIPVLTFANLEYCYKAIECPKFRPYLDSDNIMNTNPMLLEMNYPEIDDFDSLSVEDKMKVTGETNY